MSTEKLEKRVWHSYFDAMSKLLEGKQAEIEIDSLALGQRLEAEFVPLRGIAYDQVDDVVEVRLEGLDHAIHHAREVYVEHDGVNLRSVEVIDEDGAQQIIKLRDPLMLPSPQAAHAAGASPARH